jgi:hypothetical protein
MSDDCLGRCWQCGTALDKVDYGRETECRGCGKPTRCCRNCEFFAPGRPNECIEPIAERVLDKARPNFCEFFAPSRTPQAGPDDSSAEALLKAAQDLFK